MYEHFTDRARKVMRWANQEAQRLGNEYIDTEHILLGLIKEGSGVAANVLKNLGVELRKIHREIEWKIVLSRPDRVTTGKLPQTPRAKMVIAFAIEQARNLNHNYVGTEHLLLGLLCEQKGVAAQILMNLGLKLKDVRREILKSLGQNVEVRQGGGKPSKPAPQADPYAELQHLPEHALQALKNLDAQIEQLNREKEAAVDEQDFEKAAHLRDQADKLKKKKDTITREWREKLVVGQEALERLLTHETARPRDPNEETAAMYERFTDRARKVMQLANQEAQRLNHEYIGTEHILLGLIKEGSGVAANVLKNLGLDLQKIRQEVEKIVLSGPDMVTMGKLPQTPRAKKVIEYAVEEARNLKHNYVGTEHLLLGLLREREGVAAQVLMNLLPKLEDVRKEVLAILGHDMDAGEGGRSREPARAGRLVRRTRLHRLWLRRRPLLSIFLAGVVATLAAALLGANLSGSQWANLGALVGGLIYVAAVVTGYWASGVRSPGNR